MTAKPIATHAIIASPSGDTSHIAPNMSSMNYRLLDLSVVVRRKADLGVALRESSTAIPACLAVDR
ncbi:hypothetical protein [Sorangium sp. So ce1153]|uniref:hypothetical protein n=1 Tax=Sorangium sp. So ce1153 TaxID=3133333 RepID=UPI003F644264